ncbi:MAG TPA: GntR family transcriptional regulator [Beijerinckiaceae bacterium]|nr:GntR family transcriptional regulator [Beijerinckiaceae bacterium]
MLTVVPGPVERPKTLTDIAAAAIREAIITGRIAQGEQVSEAQLAGSLGLSKTPVREALLRLQTEGLVAVSPHRGTFVFSLSDGELTHICELRLALETGAVILALERNRERLVSGWLAILDRMGAALNLPDPAAYLVSDSEFHEHLIHCSGNRYFQDAYSLIAAKVTTLRLKLGRDSFHMEKSFLEHRLLVDHVRTGAVEQAQQVLRRHIARKEGSYWEQLRPVKSSYLDAS